MYTDAHKLCSTESLGFEWFLRHITLMKNLSVNTNLKGNFLQKLQICMQYLILIGVVGQGVEHKNSEYFSTGNIFSVGTVNIFIFIIWLVQKSHLYQCMFQMNVFCHEIHHVLHPSYTCSFLFCFSLYFYGPKKGSADKKFGKHRFYTLFQSCNEGKIFVSVQYQQSANITVLINPFAGVNKNSIQNLWSKSMNCIYFILL